MSKLESMDDLFMDEIRDLYDAEKQLTKALPKMAKASSSPGLRAALEGHLKQTERHVERLEEIFDSLGAKSTGKKCAAMVGLTKEGDELVGETDKGPLRDAGLISAAQKVEHYEIAGYGSARAHAQLLGHTAAVSLLDMTLGEEKQANRKLNDLAEGSINEAAGASGTGEASETRRTTGPKTRTAGD